MIEKSIKFYNYNIIILFSVCSEIGTFMSNDRNQDEVDNSLSINDVEGKVIFVINTFIIQ